jgi:hypothetical protein
MKRIRLGSEMAEHTQTLIASAFLEEKRNKLKDGK